MLFLFDIDGTLVGTHGAGMRALARAVADLHGRDDACEGIHADGKTDPLIIAEIFDRLHGRVPLAAELDAVIERYLTHLADEVVRSRYRVLPGVEAALDLLEGRGATLGLATGNVERGAEIKLRRGDLWRRFSFGGYGSDDADRARLVARAIERGGSPPREHTWVIGDTPRDIDAARKNGVRVIAVATGPHRVDALRDADVVMETLDEFPAWLAGFIDTGSARPH